MTLSEFLTLGDLDRAAAVRNGIAVADREDESYKIILYQIDGFYIEVYCDKKRRDLARVLVFSSVEHLGPYLEEINIDELFI